MTNVLFAAGGTRWEQYRGPLSAAFEAAGVEARLAPEMAPEEVDYIVYAPASEVRDFTPFSRLKAVLNIWAGVENVVGNATLRVPLARMVDPGLTEGMVEYVTGHVLRHHLGMDAQVRGLERWEPVVPPLARDRRVGVLGLGALGAACAGALARLNFDVAGWSRRPKTLDGVETFAGAEGLEAVLARSEILVLLVPHTAETESLIDARALARLPEGAVLINPARGALVDEAALVAALDAGRLGHATLDVFRQEPLPPDHAFWAHPKVTVTPHIASHTRPETAARVLAENVRRGEAGEPLLHVVDRAAGY